jgi:UDPglucose 6-dehydrogenase
MNIAVIGTGYVGLVSGVCLASKKHMVTCFDTNKSTIEILKNGESPIHENGLKELMIKNEKHICFRVLDSSCEMSLLDFDAILIAVGTPTVNGKTDLGQVKSVAVMVGRILKNSEKYVSIILKSTVVPGTTDTFFKDIVENESGKKLGHFGLGMNPEFLREGNAVEDFLSPDRIVLGYEDEGTLKVLREMYLPWECQKVELNSRSAEMMKYVNNTLLATLISSVNEYANIAREIGGIDFQQVMHGVHLDNRWSPLMEDGRKLFPKIIDYLKPGCGFGGSCFPKDVKALSSLASEISTPSKIINSVITVNDRQPNCMIEMLESKVTDLSNKRVLILGLAFKPETDDVRESVSLKLINLLSDKVASLSVHDPIAMQNTKKVIGRKVNLDYVKDWKAAIENSDVVIIATNWSIYKSINEFSDSLSEKLIFDTRSFLDPSCFNSTNYLSIN